MLLQFERFLSRCAYEHLTPEEQLLKYTVRFYFIPMETYADEPSDSYQGTAMQQMNVLVLWCVVPLCFDLQ